MAETLLVIREGVEAGKEIPLEGSLTVGRAEDADLVLDDQGISRTHARLTADPAGPLIEDLGSTNGTFVNGQRVTGAHRLSGGDEIQMGAAVVEVVGGSGETQVMAPDAGATEAHPPPPAPVPIPPPPPEPIPPPAPQAPPEAIPPPPRRQPIAQPQRAAPAQRDAVNDWNLPALAAIVLGPLSILLIVFSSGSGFYAALPVAICGIALGTIGRNKVDRGESARFRGLASVGRTFGIVGTILASIILVALIVITQALDVSAESIGELIDEVRDEIDSR
ncbi:MAG: FHA domain-containing protein [bacterium]